MAILTLTSDNKLKLQCSFLERDLAKRISGAYYNREDQSWLYSFSKDRVASFRKYFESIEISERVLEAEKKEIGYEKQLIELKNLKKVDVDWKFKVKPFDHQKVAINYLLNVNGAMLADDLGLGKSFVCLMVSIIRKSKGEIKKALIICPATTKYSVWAHEIEKFTDENYMIIDGDKKTRIELYEKWLKDDKIFFCVVNYELLLIDIPYLSTFSSDSLIVCLPYETKIKIAKGEKNIGDIVENKIRKKVLTFNEKKNILELKSIKHFFKRKFKGFFIEIDIGRKKIKLTPEHLVATEQGWKEAQNLKVNDVIISLHQNLL